MKQLQKQFVDFYVQFHQQQHYFLCHDILEEVWKSQKKYCKKDPIVALILIATGCYHYRRENFNGAYRSFQKALHLIQQHRAETFRQLGVHQDQLQQLIARMVENTAQKRPFAPLMLPLTKEMTEAILKYEPNYNPTTTVVTTPLILNHHKLRDRTEVVHARQLAQKNKKR